MNHLTRKIGFILLTLFLMLQSCSTKKIRETTSYDFITELNTRYDSIYSKNEGDKLNEEVTSLLDDYKDSVILNNSFVFSIEKVKGNENEYSPNERKVKYKIKVQPYKKVEDGTLVIISDYYLSYGENSGSLITREPKHKYLKTTYSEVIINVYEDLKDGIYPPVRLSKQIFGSGDQSFFVSDVSMKVILKNMKRKTFNQMDMGNVCEFDLVEVTNVKPVVSDLRTKFESEYQLNYPKFFNSKSSDVLLNTLQYDPYTGGTVPGERTDYIVPKKPLNDTINVEQSINTDTVGNDSLN